MNVEELKAALLGTWVSIAPEVRPSRNPDGTFKPFFLERRFVYTPQDRFELTVTTLADPVGAHGMLFWGARHVDGRGFDTEANRPTNLQIPLTRA